MEGIKTTIEEEVVPDPHYVGSHLHPSCTDWRNSLCIVFDPFSSLASEAISKAFNPWTNNLNVGIHYTNPLPLYIDCKNNFTITKETFFPTIVTSINQFLKNFDFEKDELCLINQ